MTEQELGQKLFDKFSNWLNTESEDLIFDQNLVLDHLSDDIPRKELNKISSQIWVRAWEIFDILAINS